MKVTKLLAAAALCVVAACSSSTPSKDIVLLYNDASKHVAKADSPEELTKINTDLYNNIDRIREENPDYVPTPQEEQEIQQALIDYNRAVMNAMQK